MGFSAATMYGPPWSGSAASARACTCIMRCMLRWYASQVLGYGTTFIRDLYEYMQTLHAMAALSPLRLYPGHGPVVNDAMDVLRRYIDHRETRQEQVQSTPVPRARVPSAPVPSTPDLSCAFAPSAPSLLFWPPALPFKPPLSFAPSVCIASYGLCLCTHVLQRALQVEAVLRGQPRAWPLRELVSTLYSQLHSEAQRKMAEENVQKILRHLDRFPQHWQLRPCARCMLHVVCCELCAACVLYAVLYVVCCVVCCMLHAVLHVCVVAYCLELPPAEQLCHNASHMVRLCLRLCLPSLKAGHRGSAAARRQHQR